MSRSVRGWKKALAALPLDDCGMLAIMPTLPISSVSKSTMSLDSPYLTVLRTSALVLVNIMLQKYKKSDAYRKKTIENLAHSEKCINFAPAK